MKIFLKSNFKFVLRVASNLFPQQNAMQQHHTKACSPDYPLSKTKRFPVPQDKISWSAVFDEYVPVEYTAESVQKGPVWADPDIKQNLSKKLLFNEIDGRINRKSFTGEYTVKEGIPMNPCGRTGITGRGLLGKWGPNHAADPIVTRWKRDKDGDIVKHTDSNKSILQFVAVQRRDNNEWAIPGGMVDANETVSYTLKREFGEEALNSLAATEEKKREIEKHISALFSEGKVVFQGYVDDPRNTDNAWMESVAVNFHDESGDSVGMLPLSAGDDAGAVCWMDLDRKLNLYASHLSMLETVASSHNAHW